MYCVQYKQGKKVRAVTFRVHVTPLGVDADLAFLEKWRLPTVVTASTVAVDAFGDIEGLDSPSVTFQA